MYIHVNKTDYTLNDYQSHAKMLQAKIASQLGQYLGNYEVTWVPLCSQGHFGLGGGNVERLNTTLPQWEAAGILPVNRVSTDYQKTFASSKVVVTAN